MAAAHRNPGTGPARAVQPVQICLHRAWLADGQPLACRYGTVGCLAERGAAMSLFVAVHQHAPERCPAGDPTMGPMLLNHLSAANAAKYGVSVQAEAVANDKHTLYLIAEAGDEEQMNRFLAPFAQAGSVELLPASSCEVVIDRGGCAQVPA